ncbi:SWIB domain-containing protein [Ordospora colligata]|uniref:SWIB domain-containing protein n=1 Tax=Ordospora colligata OC4 TaxID=1354746 RepID=A0A0B2UKS3_9MICR|nr:SWIB domain-containing protein [Ordospora colligata OC4]KHN69968.1 SWIB domain-containing protein [Ordospora colligata OC4]TBU16138.1 SWIB domain-containing protein [Ordospora colligata]TBU19055.1 SWIB domain-containing protein [Ordospora colligata]
MSDGVDEKLRRIEKEVDKMCLQRKLSIEAEYLKRIKCRKTLRCYVKVEVNNGMFIRMDSRVINDYKSGGEMKFSDVVKRFCVVLNNNIRSTSELYTEQFETDGINEDIQHDVKHDTSHVSKNMDVNDFFEWAKGKEDIEAFEVSTKKEPESIRLIFELENPRDIWRLSPKLSKLLMRYTDTKPNVITHLWRYVNKNGLMKTGSDLVKCDGSLKEILGVDEFVLTELTDMIVPHLLPLDFLTVNVPVQHGYTNIFDIPFEWDDLYQHPVLYSKRIHAVDRKIESLRQILKKCEEREKVLNEFAKDPVHFINKWLCIQMNEQCHRTLFFRNEEVQKGIFELLKRLE